MLPAIFSLLISAAATCLGSLLLGGGVLALCGAKRWSWLAPAVGVATVMLLAVPALHLPGRCTTVAVIIGACSVAAALLWIRRPEHRPPAADLLAALPVALLALVPFAAAGRAGTLGVSFDNDMSVHLLLAEAYRSGVIVSALSGFFAEYPLGPHALVATIVEGLGLRTDLAFAGLTAAIPVLLAWTALAALARVRWAGRILAATVIALPFLIASYYAEGSFKELFEALFALAAAFILSGLQPSLGARRWIPFALLCAGAASVYSLQGVFWPGLFLALWLLVRWCASAWRSGGAQAWRHLRAELAPGALGLGVLALVLVPQIPRIERFLAKGTANGIEKTSLGNLVGPVSGWEAFGTWSNPDFRLPPPNSFGAGMWTAFVLGLVILGAFWALRSGRPMLAGAGILAVLVWVYASQTQSPYVAAKALVIASPLLLVLAVLPLVTPSASAPTWWRLGAPVLALLLAFRVVDSSLQALRHASVGPSDHLVELRSLRPLLAARPTLFLGDDQFVRWELAGVPVTAAYLSGAPKIALQKVGQPLDFDSVKASVLDEFQWVITTNDAAGSAPPPQMHLIRATRDYELWKRIGTVQPREILDEGPNAAAPLQCDTPAGRALLARRGVAAIRAPSVEVSVPALAPGTSASVSIDLGSGSWELEAPYESPLPIHVSAPGLQTTLPANLDIQGPRLPIGRLVISHGGPMTVTFKLSSHWLTPSSDVSLPAPLIATPLGTEHLVSLRKACGKYVDWYTSS